MTEPHVTLFSSSLLSKWGFSDGDDPGDWLDYCEARGIDYTVLGFPLVALVRQYLLPRIEQPITVVEVETIHNPIRAETVNGQDMTETWFGRAPEPTLTPEYVEVPMSEVLGVALAEAGLTKPPRFTPPLPLS
ncbi:hypothetical protein ACGFMM_01415 [Streptomyces sp. NPDC048604]|uniref:hypothetical protein n=1 Tax=Streptomyces sp. NPDC048604 TaxID=3365578 RepID=UPI00371DF0F9